MVDVRLSRRAAKDLDAMTNSRASRILDFVDRLAKESDNPGLDVKPLVGRRPWRRLRAGDYRVLFRIDRSTLLVARVIHRRELEQAVSTLPD